MLQLGLKSGCPAVMTSPNEQVIIAGAGGAAHLPGMVAALTPLPVIGVPVTPKGAHLDGLDALMSIVQVARFVRALCNAADTSSSEQTDVQCHSLSCV